MRTMINEKLGASHIYENLTIYIRELETCYKYIVCTISTINFSLTYRKIMQTFRIVYCLSWVLLVAALEESIE